METKKIYLTLIILLGFNFTNKSYGQATSAGNLNIPTASGEFLGWAVTSN